MEDSDADVISEAFCSSSAGIKVVLYANQWEEREISPLFIYQ
jgi:hypothetical protein